VAATAHMRAMRGCRHFQKIAVWGRFFGPCDVTAGVLGWPPPAQALAPPRLRVNSTRLCSRFRRGSPPAQALAPPRLRVNSTRLCSRFRRGSLSSQALAPPRLRVYPHTPMISLPPRLPAYALGCQALQLVAAGHRLLCALSQCSAELSMSGATI